MIHEIFLLGFLFEASFNLPPNDFAVDDLYLETNIAPEPFIKDLGLYVPGPGMLFSKSYLFNVKLYTESCDFIGYY